MSTPPPNEALGLRELAQAQQKQLDEISGEYNSYKKATVIALETSGVPAVTINLSGAEDVDIPGVHYLDYYAPQLGDTVLVVHQGAELLVIGRVASEFADGTWTEMELNTGWSHDATGANGAGRVKYRRVIDHGAYKIQWKGAAVRSSGSTTITQILPHGYRPTSRRIFVAARNTDQALPAQRIQFESNGFVVYSGATMTSSGTSQSHTHFVPAPASVQSQGQNQAHTHDIANLAPDWIEFNGIEYFVED